MAFWKSSNPGIVLVKIIFGLPILILQSIWIYVFGCCGVYAQRCVNGLCCGLCVCGGCTFRDRRFPPKAQSLGAWKGKSLDQVAQETEWLRIKDICKKAGHAGAKLFSGEIESADICQGQLGDCWLMSAFSSLAECPGAIQKVFVTREYNHYGKYVVKAMAKMCGSYAALDGGNMVWALQAMTGDEVFKFLYEPKTGSWVRHDLVHLPERGVRKIGLKRTGECLSHDRMFHVMRQYVKNASVIGASTGGGKDTENTNGIVHGHAYSVMDAQHVEGFRMVRLRNPWGTFEWQGAWSDHHPNWEKYPKVKRKLDFSRTSDGTFWMEWKDFIQHYRSLDFCARTTGWDDLVLDIHEESRCCGPMIGCAEGCFKFWCCCYGLRVLFCSRRTKAKTAKPAGQGACCCCCQS